MVSIPTITMNEAIISNGIIADNSGTRPSDSLTTLFESSVNNVMNKHAPLRTVTVRKHKSVPWWSEDLSVLKRKLRKSERKWRESKLNVFLMSYKSVKIAYHREIRKAKQRHLADNLNKTKNEPKKMWKVLNGALGRVKQNILPSHTSSISLSEDFNTFFINKVQTIRDSIPDMAYDSSFCHVQEPAQLAYWQPATESEVARVIKNSPAKSDTVDCIPTWLLLKHLNSLLPALTAIVNCSLTFGVPKAYKHSLIRPLLKKKGSDSSALSNYRPVSILPYISKLIERIVKLRLSDFLESNKLLDSYQSAYRANHSCETALMYVMNELFLSMDNSKIAVLALYDLTAAFDTVDHCILGQILTTIGIVEHAHSWIIDYLTNRSQSVSINNMCSSALSIKHGVPQGTVLGPLLFCIYMNGISSVVTNQRLKYMTYADDLQVIATADPTSINDCLESIKTTTTKIHEWLNQRKLKMNSSKTEILLVGNSRVLRKLNVNKEIEICGEKVKISEVVRNLGLYIDDSLTLSPHITRISGQAFSYLKIIGRLRQCLTVQMRMTAIHALVISRIHFCAPLFMGIGKKLLHQLQRVLNASIKMTLNSKDRERWKEKISKEKWLPVEYLIQYRYLCLIDKIIRSGSPVYLAQLIKAYEPSRDLRSSSSYLLEVPRTRTKAGERAFATMAPQLWNSLPLNLRSIPKHSTFCNQLYELLLHL
jgi:hypothetical protein